MGNLISSFISGFTKVVGDLFGAPLDFLSGKSCSSICGSTWDLICYIENFCIANLLKMLMVLVLFYIVLLFLYLIHKSGICDCIGRSLCKMLWVCLASCFSTCEYGCSLLCFKMRMHKHMNKTRRRDIEQELFDDDPSTTTTTTTDEELDYDESVQYVIPPRSIDMMRRSSSSSFYRPRERRRIHLQRSLWPRNHRLRVGIISKNNAVYLNPSMLKHHHYYHRKQHISTVHNIKVTKTSTFVKKGNNRLYWNRRW